MIDELIKITSRRNNKNDTIWYQILIVMLHFSTKTTISYGIYYLNNLNWFNFSSTSCKKDLNKNIKGGKRNNFVCLLDQGYYVDTCIFVISLEVIYSDYRCIFIEINVTIYKVIVPIINTFPSKTMVYYRYEWYSKVKTSIKQILSKNKSIRWILPIIKK